MKTSSGLMTSITTPLGGLHLRQTCKQRPGRVHLGAICFFQGGDRLGPDPELIGDGGDQGLPVPGVIGVGEVQFLGSAIHDAIVPLLRWLWDA